MGQSGIKRRFRGSFSVKIDDKGRIKVPSKYLSVLEDHYGREIYLTSINGDYILFYPLKVWESIERRIEQIVINPDLQEYISRISFWGSESEIDLKGRILVPADLRLSCNLVDEILVLGKVDYMEVWNKEHFTEKYLSGRMDDDKLHGVARILNEITTQSRDEP